MNTASVTRRRLIAVCLAMTLTMCENVVKGASCPPKVKNAATCANQCAEDITAIAAGRTFADYSQKTNGKEFRIINK